jgi:DeoR family transcriptional regulator of aga operon
MSLVDASPHSKSASREAPSRPLLRRSDRVTAILGRLAAGHRVDVAGVAHDLGVSVATIRRDLSLLDEQRLLTRTHGGAVARDVAYEIPVRYRESQGRAKKQAIARLALLGMPSGPHIVAVNGGTTTAEVARLLAGRSGLTVVTNALNVASLLANRPRVKLVLTGGVVRCNSSELVGPWAEGTVGRVTVDTAFIGVDGISAAAGLSTHDDVEAHINALMIGRARRVVVVADGSKVGSSHLAHVADLSAVDELVTDDSADPHELATIAARGVTVRVAVVSAS